MSSAVRYQVMPPLSSEEYQELHDDIKVNGVLEPIHVDEEGVVIDGHHRSKIANELGIPCPVITHDDLDDAGKRSLAFTLNLKRRHLNREQRRALIAESLKSDPQLSNREHAKRVGVDHKTVQSVRASSESNGEIPHYAPGERQEASGRSARGVSTHQPEPAPSITSTGVGEVSQSPTYRPDMDNPQLDRVDPELEARVKAMSSAPGTGKHISATSAAERNETRYSAQITAREIISKQKELIALLANVGGFNGMDNYLQIMQENHDTIREMSQTGGIDAELNNLIGGK